MNGRSWVRLLAPLLLLAPTALAGQSLPLGDEFQVNSFTTGSQSYPSVASAGDGNFAVVWTSGGQDGSYFGGFGGLLTALAPGPASEFPVNTFTTSDQAHFSMSTRPSGDFVVVWQSRQDGSDYGIFGQRFDASGTKVGPEFQVNTYTTGYQFRPSVAADPAGDFVVVWESTQDYGVFGQRFDKSGTKQGPEFALDSYTTGEQGYPVVAVDGLGNFVVVWEDSSQDGDNFGIFGQRFDASGTKIGPEFQVNTYTTGKQDLPSLAMDRQGNFVVVWRSSGQDGDSYGIFGQRFNSSAEPLGIELQVNSYTTGIQDDPSVAYDEAGDFLVVWSSTKGSNRDADAQKFDRLGNPIGPEFTINTGVSVRDRHPSVAGDGAGFVVAYMSYQQDGSYDGIFGRQQNLVPGPMKVDAHSGGGSSSDANGVLEPGEAVRVEPTWSRRPLAAIINGLTGTASNFTGPFGGIYLLNDSTADYGGSFLNPVSSSNCYDATGAHDCYTVSVAGSRPATHWDASFVETMSSGGGQRWKLHVADSFTDVPRSQPFYRKIETLLHYGVTLGCAAAKYCPNDPVPRDQMAIFIAKAMAGAGELVPNSGKALGSDYVCGPLGFSLFSDVAITDSFCRHVHYLAAKNVTLGCGVAQYCPGQTVTRDAMASFIAKALVAPGGGNAVPETYGPDPVTGLSYSCNAGSPNTHFSDVSVSHPFCKHVHYLWARGIVGGCSATQYCPTLAVNRDAMAKFIANAFGLELYGP